MGFISFSLLWLLCTRVWELKAATVDDGGSSDNFLVHIVALVHLSNEEFLLPFWIRHHASIFDAVLFVDWNSTDRSKDIIASMAPVHWRYERTKRSNFTSTESDAEMAMYELEYPIDSWKIILTVGEFIVSPNLRSAVGSAILDQNSLQLLRIPNVLMVGDDSIPLDHNKPLVLQRSNYGIETKYLRNWYGLNRFARFMHRGGIVGQDMPLWYGAGRHFLISHNGFVNERVLHSLNISWAVLDIAFIAKYKLTPWPESISRMINLYHTYPESRVHNPGRMGEQNAYLGHDGTEHANYFVGGVGGSPPRFSIQPHHHQFGSAEELHQYRDIFLNSQAVFNLADVHIDGAQQDPSYSIRQKFHSTYLSATGASPHYIFSNRSLINASGSRFAYTDKVGVGGPGGCDSVYGSRSSVECVGFDDRFAIPMRVIYLDTVATHVFLLSLQTYLTNDVEAVTKEVVLFCGDIPGCTENIIGVLRNGQLVDPMLDV